jgi:hypothetical protein
MHDQLVDSRMAPLLTSRLEDSDEKAPKDSTDIRKNGIYVSALSTNSQDVIKRKDHPNITDEFGYQSFQTIEGTQKTGITKML